MNAPDDLLEFYSRQVLRAALHSGFVRQYTTALENIPEEKLNQVKEVLNDLIEEALRRREEELERPVHIGNPPEHQPKVCDTCHGTGEVFETEQGTQIPEGLTCYTCDGTGSI